MEDLERKKDDLNLGPISKMFFFFFGGGGGEYFEIAHYEVACGFLESVAC